MEGGRRSRGRGRGASRGGGRGRIHSANGPGARSAARSSKQDGKTAADEVGSGSKRKVSSGSTSRGRGGRKEDRSGRGRGQRGGRIGAAAKGSGRGSKGVVKGDGVNGGGSAEGDGLPSNKKRRLKLERQQHRPEFDTVARAKQIWNKLRERKVPRDDRAKLVQELLRLIKGKVPAIAMKHDASRVVQTALQFGNREERLALLDELEGHLVELSQLMYSHHIVQRLFRDAKGPEEQKRLAKVFRGHGVRLATHAIGAEVVQTALISLPTASAGLIKSEFYGKEFALFDDGDSQPRTLKAVLESRPDRRAVVMDHVHDVIGKLLSKGLMKFQFAHDLLWEYFQEATPARIQEMVPRLLEPYLVLLSTRAGSMCAAVCAAYGGAKERKRMMRSLKGHVVASLIHRDSYVAVIRLVESVDDTITCQKTILAELLKPTEVSIRESGVPKVGKGTSAEEWVPKGTTAPRGGRPEGGVSKAELQDEDGVTGMDVDESPAEGGGREEEKVDESAPPALLEVMTSRNGCKLLLRLLAPEHTGYLHPEELELLKPTMIPASAPKTSGSSEASPAAGTEVKLVPSSKKEPSVRQRELLAYLREPLREVCASHAGELMRSKFAGALVLLEAIRGKGTPQLVQAVAQAACAKPLDGQLPMFEDAAGHLFMKQLLKREAAAQEADPAAIGDETDSSPLTAPSFAEALLDRAGGELVSWVGSNRGAFVVAALEQVPSASARVRKVLGAKAARSKVVDGAKAEGNNVGVKVLAEQLGYGDFGAKAAKAASDVAEASTAKNSGQKKKL